MRIGEAVRRATQQARRAKERHVREVKGRAGRTDISTMIEFYRGDEVVAAVFHQPERDVMLETIWIGATGFSADVVGVTMETFQSGQTTNPITGQPWGAGELAEVAEEHDGLVKGWVKEALVTHVANRAGDARQVVQTYALDGRTVEWEPKAFDTEDEDAHAEGFVVDTIREAMEQATIFQHAARGGFTPDAFGLSPERGQAHADVAAVRVLEDRLGGQADLMVLLWAEPGSVRAQVLRERLPRSQVLRPEDGS